MTKDVLVSMSGLQFEIDKEETVEVIVPAKYYFKSGKHYIFYEEDIEDGITRNRMEFDNSKVDILKKGTTTAHMVFEEKHTNMSYYDTPFGQLIIHVNAHNINIKESEESIVLNVEYSLDINYAHVSACSICVKIVPRGKLLS